MYSVRVAYSEVDKGVEKAADRSSRTLPIAHTCDGPRVCACSTKTPGFCFYLTFSAALDHSETAIYSGSVDGSEKPHGRGTLTWKSGDRFEGRFKHGEKEGKGCFYFSDGSSLGGTFSADELFGKGIYVFDDGSWQEGQYVHGELNGLVKEFDNLGNLTFTGNYVENCRHGLCTFYDPYGGTLNGVVDEEGSLTGDSITYWYPGCELGIRGKFLEGILDRGFLVEMKDKQEEEEKKGDVFERDVSTKDCISANPLLPDPYETKMVYVKVSPIAGDGLFARRDLPEDRVVSFYNGIRLTHQEVDSRDWSQNDYTISLDSETVIDIPPSCSDVAAYCASLGHKANHSFEANCKYDLFDHPRFGLIKSIRTLKRIRRDEELTVEYGYDHHGLGKNNADAPHWYKSQLK
ncbi:histone-lysine N-methyltransferase SETD7-like [Oscarella lobularis]|uniref:histone-lysine N-methyltransferase SETD7-like n=1 Tax=Oscarella lobularis TaxID=121494 RepID=UPI0033139AD8